MHKIQVFTEYILDLDYETDTAVTGSCTSLPEVMFQIG